MKLTRVILAAAVIASAACTKNQDIPETAGDNASQMTIKAVNPGFTKTTTTDGATVLWENGDEIAVFVSGGYVDGVNTNKSAIFKTSVSTPASSATFHCTNGEIPVTQPDELDENKGFTVQFANSDTGDLAAGTFSWDVRYIIHPYYDEAGNIIDGDQVITPKTPMELQLLQVVGEV